MPLVIEADASVAIRGKLHSPNDRYTNSIPTDTR